MLEANYSEAEITERIRQKQANGEYFHEWDVLHNHLSKEKADNALCMCCTGSDKENICGVQCSSYSLFGNWQFDEAQFSDKKGDEINQHR